jgi:hypothetical protein
MKEIDQDDDRTMACPLETRRCYALHAGPLAHTYRHINRTGTTSSLQPLETSLSPKRSASPDSAPCFLVRSHARRLHLDVLNVSSCSVAEDTL